MKKNIVPVGLFIAAALLTGCLRENTVENNAPTSSREAQVSNKSEDGYPSKSAICDLAKPKIDCELACIGVEGGKGNWECVDPVTKPDPIYTKTDPICTKPNPITVIDPRCPKELPPIDCILACVDNSGGAFSWQCKDMSNRKSDTTGING